MVWQASAEIVKVWFAPQFTDTLPVGEMLPPLAAEAEIVYVIKLNDAEIVWFAVTLLNV